MRQSLAGRVTDRRRIDRDLAEVHERNAFGFGDALDFGIEGGRLERIFDEEHCHAIAFRQIRVHLAEELMRHRKQKTRTVSGFRVSTSCTAVHEPLQDSNALKHNLVRSNIINIGDQADTAGVMFVGRIVKSLCVHKIPFFFSRKQARYYFCERRLQNSCQFLKAPANY